MKDDFRELTEEELTNMRLGLMDASDGNGVIIALVRMGSDQGSCAYLGWKEAKEFADRIYAKYKRHLKGAV